MIASLHRAAHFGLTALVFAVLSPSGARAAEPSRAADLDAVCPWGRLSDGHGRLVRCLSRDDVTRLRDAAQAPGAAAPKPELAPAPPVEAPVAPGTAPTADAPRPKEPPPAPATVRPPAGESQRPKETPPAAPDARGAPGIVAVEPAPVAPAVPAPATEPTPLDVEFGPVVTEGGNLPDAQKNFRKARERIAACVDKNGGLSADRGSVELRFLVQGLGRAEGVSVKKHRGLSEAAAKCVGNVVDRRYVGYPDEPAVAATVVVTLSKKRH